MSGGTPLSANSQAFIPTPNTLPPATIPGSNGTYVTGPLNVAGMKGFAVGATLSTAGTLVIQRYLDVAGTIAIGAAISQVMSAATPATAAFNDGIPAASCIVTITNTSGGVGNLTNVSFLAAFPSG
jgi:hypothetical protein